MSNRIKGKKTQKFKSLGLYTLVGPTVTRPVQDPLAVFLLDNRLYISIMKNTTKQNKSWNCVMMPKEKKLHP